MSLFPEAKAGRMPVSLVTGFLGSGKTTLINRLLKHPEMANTAIVVNEFGDVALDQHFIEASDGDMVVLANGCVCCTAQGDLGGVIGALYGKRQGGAPFSRLLIETTGLADPAPVMQTLLSQPFLANNFALDAAVTTVDAMHGASALADPTAEKQAALADQLVITKTDLALPDAVAALARRLRGINPAATILRVPAEEATPARLFGAAGARDPAAWARHEHHSDHLSGIETFTLALDAPVEWRRFSRFLTRLKVRHAERLLRVKGVIAVAGEDAMVAIHGVHHVFHPPERLPRRSANLPSRLVFITKGPLRPEIERDWRAEAG